MSSARTRALLLRCYPPAWRARMFWANFTTYSSQSLHRNACAWVAVCQPRICNSAATVLGGRVRALRPAAGSWRYISETVTAMYFLPSRSTTTCSVVPFLTAPRFLRPTNFVFDVT